MGISKDPTLRPEAGPSRVVGTTGQHAAGPTAAAEDMLVRGRNAADRIGTAVGETLQSAAAAVRHSTGEEGRLGKAAEAVADRLEQAGLYLEEENAAAVGRDLTHVIRRYPVPALLIAAGLGFLIGRMRT